MSTTRRAILAAAGAGLATLEIGKAVSASLPSAADELAELINLSRDSNAALMKGDIDKYMKLIIFADDFTLMSPFGGKPTHGFGSNPEQIAALGRFFSNGSFDLEVVQAYWTTDMIVLALIERTNAEVGTLPSQNWALRVTLVYRREGKDWHLAHRHADPIVDSISLEQAAAIARGERNFLKPMRD